MFLPYTGFGFFSEKLSSKIHCYKAVCDREVESFDAYLNKNLDSPKGPKIGI